MRSDKETSILGAMMGGAIGEAYGMYAFCPVCTSSLQSVPDLSIGPATKASMFVANGLMLGDTYLADKGIGTPHIRDAYALGAWRFSNTHRYGEERKAYSPLLRFWLLDRPEVYSPTTDAVVSMPLLRAAPHALYEYRFACNNPHKAIRHISEYNTLSPSACMLIFMLMEILQQGSDIVLQTLVASYLRTWSNKATYMSARLGYLLYRILDGEVPVAAPVSEEEILASALYCAISGSTYEEVILRALAFEGNRAAVAYIAGTLAGALLTYDAIPGHLRCSDGPLRLVHEMAADLVTGAQLSVGVSETPGEKRWASKYIF